MTHTLAHNHNLHAGNKVRFKSPKGLWKLGVISDKKPSTPCSDNVISEQGHTHRTNRQDIFTTNEKACINNKPKLKDITITTTPMHALTQAPVLNQGQPKDYTPVKPAVIIRSGRVEEPPKNIY